MSAFFKGLESIFNIVIKMVYDPSLDHDFTKKSEKNIENLILARCAKLLMPIGIAGHLGGKLKYTTKVVPDATIIANYKQKVTHFEPRVTFNNNSCQYV